MFYQSREIRNFAMETGRYMSIKKELLDKLSEEQLREIAENKGIKFTLSKTQEKYYEDWDEKDKIVDVMSCKEALTVKEIEDYIKTNVNF